jgi:hypothetical protein
MQPIHSREARWFWEWDRLELARGTGMALFATGALLLLASLAVPSFYLPLRWGWNLSITGLLLFALAYCLDGFGKGWIERKLRCRSCRAEAAAEKVMRNKWACKKCGSAGRFDNVGQ